MIYSLFRKCSCAVLTHLQSYTQVWWRFIKAQYKNWHRYIKTQKLKTFVPRVSVFIHLSVAKPQLKDHNIKLLIVNLLTINLTDTHLKIVMFQYNYFMK